MPCRKHVSCTCTFCKVQQGFLQNETVGIQLVGCFASHVHDVQETYFLCTSVSCKMFPWYKFEHYCLRCEHVGGDFLHMSCKISSTYFKNLEFLVKCGKHYSGTSTSKYRYTQPSFLIALPYFNSSTCFDRLLQVNLCTVCLCGNETQACSAVHAHVTVATNSKTQFVAIANLLRCGKHHLLTW